MSQDDGRRTREAARNRLLGRAMVVGLLALAALYAIVTFLGRR